MASEFPTDPTPPSSALPPPPPTPPPSMPPATSNMIERIKRILMSPKTEWPAIEAEPMTVQGILSGWVAPLAAIGPIAHLIQGQLFPVSFFGVTWRPPLVGSIVTAVLAWGLTIAMTYVWSLIIDALAPSFGGTKNAVSALKVAAFSATAGWIGGIFSLLPLLALIGVLCALYGLYLLWIGAPMLMKVPQDKAPGFVIVSILVGIVAWVVAGMVAAAIGAAMFAMSPGAGVLSTPSGSISIGSTMIDSGKLDTPAADIHAVNAQI